ncbi:MAG: glutamine-hydrolyzing carbamoyl-phosphate synthase small subunit [Thermoprotei archaeon]|jgi:carbamoyl-phosphate synthase small subunit
MTESLNAILVLEDGSVWIGKGFGYPKRVIGEVVFNTGMTGYTEALTDPSYRGQILVMTYPLIGNYGVPSYNIKDSWGLPLHFESERIQVNGLVVYEACDAPSHVLSKKSLHEWLYEEKVPGIQGIDTRELTKRLRSKGVMMGILEVSQNDISIDNLINELKNTKRYDEIKFAHEVSTKKPIIYGNGNETIVLIDCGVKVSIIRNLIEKGFRVIRLPYNTNIDEVLAYNPKGIVLSNGPGNPRSFTETIELTRQLIDMNIPIMGICLGNQILALGMGADTFKLKYGHRGQNKPSINLITKKSYVTSQNHGFAVNPDSLKNTGLEVWWINADDKTVEGIKHKNKPILAVQFHPEASPGPYDTLFVFDIFREKIHKHNMVRIYA